MRTLYSRISKWFPIPRVMEMYYAAVHISSSNMITYLEMERRGDDLIPVAYERVAFRKQDEEDNLGLIQALTVLQRKYKTNYVKATIQESKSYLFETEVPKVGAKDLHEAVAFMIEEKAPVSLAEVVFGYRITDGSGADANVVSVGVVPEKVVNDYISIFSSAGMKPVSMRSRRRRWRMPLLRSMNRAITSLSRSRITKLSLPSFRTGECSFLQR
jgi:hypothetical protein